ncbi:MAG: hypothetical protein ACE5Q6_08910, partial [Dehalococcoidia bacterium]
MFRLLIFLGLLLLVGCAHVPLSDQAPAPGDSGPPAAPVAAPLPAESAGSAEPTAAAKVEAEEPRSDPAPTAEESIVTAKTDEAMPTAPPEAVAESVQLEADSSAQITVPMFGTVVERPEPSVETSVASSEVVIDPFLGAKIEDSTKIAACHRRPGQERGSTKNAPTRARELMVA